ncbi:TetR/AcrR family transcriptional regulator [Paracoccus saliphilus]|uniref:TetR family transcriptional regulator n=1 Tax=Paracoccus saliphilus TaxID=405559 RepID=A0AA45W1G1_9RHOB|nr:TetR/AcrR family transcriptional regulator [Paracoccus saliphilus]WCR03621.1 TetR family transcriptional regulator [Paracoccus saliphilus]SIS56794.1 transcriptional regulator, TetR family [Paracoccus saliphilus]
MNEHVPDPAAKLEERAKRKAAKREVKKTEIAASTLDALKQLGYANTTLRDIAAQSGMSLGSLTYYFTDKVELITYCVRLYKAEFIDRIEKSVTSAEGRDAVIDAFADELTRSMTEDLPTHRLWYDIRSQAMFDPAFRPVVEEIEGKLLETLTRVVQAAGQQDTSAVPLGYAMIDGVFRFLLQSRDRHARDNDELMAIFTAILRRIF